MRIVVVGAIEFSRHCLREVLRNGGRVMGVLTPDRARAATHADFADLGAVAAEHGIPVYRVRDINAPESVEVIRSLSPDVMFVFGWSQIISPAILKIPPRGCIGSHPALLPRNRGRHPIVWALVQGLTESGVTFFYLDEGVDSGDIVWQRTFPITLEDDAGSVYRKVEVLASEAIREFLPQLERGTAPRSPQDHRLATYWRKRTEKDGEIQWSTPSMRTYNLIRALTRPYVGAHTYAGKKKMVVWRATFPEAERSRDPLTALPGTLLRCGDGSFDVRTGDGHLTVTSYEVIGGGPVEVGTRLGGER